MITKQEADMFGDLLSTLDDIEEGTHVPSGPSATALNETKQLLQSLNEVGADYGTLLNQDAQLFGEQFAYDNYMNDSDAKLDSIYGQYVEDGVDPDSIHNNYVPSTVQMRNVQPSQKTQIQQDRPYVPGMNWTIVEESVLGMKNAVMYSIKCNATNQVVLNNIMMYESALALRNILNSGKSLTDPKILGIISSGIQYTNVVQEAIKAARERQKVLKESRYDKAQELDSVIAEHKNKAKELKQRVLNFLEEEGFLAK